MPVLKSLPLIGPATTGATASTTFSIVSAATSIPDSPKEDQFDEIHLLSNKNIFAKSLIFVRKYLTYW